MRSILNDKLIYEVLSVVAEIPQGRVATYGQIARLIGRERNARLVGRVLAMSHWYGSYPCHRVVNHAGRLVPGWSRTRGAASEGGRLSQGKRLCGPGPVPMALLTVSAHRPGGLPAKRRGLRRSAGVLSFWPFTVSPPEVTRPICPLPPGQIR